MNLKHGQLTKIARLSKCSVAHLSDIFRGRRRPSPNLAARISAATGGEITVQELLFPSGLPSTAKLSVPLAPPESGIAAAREG